MRRAATKLTSMILAFTLLISIIPSNAYLSYAEALTKNQNFVSSNQLSKEALQKSTKSNHIFNDTVTNPEYEGLNVKTYSPSINKPAATKELATMEEAAEYLKQQMVNRVGTITFILDQSYYQTQSNEIFEMAVEDNQNGSSSEGDYLYGNWNGYSIEGLYPSGDTSKIQYTYKMKYLSTYSQEQAVNREVKNVLDKLDVYDKDTYTKVKAVHDYIVKNIEYDYSLQNHSAYNAIVEKNVVCQGFATITYKMLKDLGIGVRYITGIGNGGGHAWNIVKLGSLWYNTDNTWDENLSTSSSICYTYFLKGKNYFPDHTRDSKFNTADFNSKFPTASSNYVYSGTKQSISNASIRVNNQTYTNQPLTPPITVTLNGVTLTNGVDYKVSYSNNTSIGQATVTITGIGDYSGTARGYFNIIAPTVDSVTGLVCFHVTTNSITISWSPVYNATAYEVYACDSQYGNYELIKTTTSKITTEYNLNPNKTRYYKVRAYTLVGNSNFYSEFSNIISGTTSIPSISSATVTVSNQTYTGKALTPSVTVKLDGVTLVNGTDYTVTYKNNVEIGTATVTITGIGNYTGVTTGTFKILEPIVNLDKVYGLKTTEVSQTSIKIAWNSVSNATGYKVYASDNKTSNFTLISDTNSLNAVENNLQQSTTRYYKVRAYKTIGSRTYYSEYSDVLSATTSNKPKISISSATVTTSDQTYTGNSLTPTVTVKLNGGTLVNGTDYTLTYKNNIEIGTATITVTGVGNYTDTATTTFKIVAPQIDKVTGIRTILTTSNSIKIAWNEVKNATEYEVYTSDDSDFKYSVITKTTNLNFVDNNLQPNKTRYYKVKAYVKVGTKTFSSEFSDVFSEITDQKQKTPISSAIVTVSNQTYTGKALTPDVTVKLNGITLIKGSDYTVSYNNNINIGTATITITGIGDYTGTINTYFDIVAPQISKVTGLKTSSYSTDSVTMQWSSISNISGYEIYIYDEENDYYKLSGRTTNTSYTENNLNPDTTYYFKVRAYKTVGNQNFYGEFSNIYSQTTDGESEQSTLNISNYNYPTSITQGNSFSLKGTISSNYLIDYVAISVLDEEGEVVETVSKEVYPYSYSFSDLDSGIKFGTLPVGEYTYQVVASDQSGELKVLVFKDFIVKKPPVTISNISGLKFTNTTSSIKLSWNKATYATGYEIWMYSASKGNYSKIKTVTSKNTNYFTKTGLSSATMYRFKVRAYRIVNGVKYYGNLSNEFITATKPLTPKVTATAGTKKATLKWTNTSSKTTGYQVYRATTKNGSYTKIKTTTSKTYTNTGLKKGKYYYYKVRAYRVLDNGKIIYGSFSSVKSVKAK